MAHSPTVRIPRPLTGLRRRHQLPPGMPPQHDRTLKRTFRPCAPLRHYLILKYPQMHLKHRIFYTLEQVMDLIKCRIITEHLFDVRNTTIILCNGELEHALQTRALHVEEVKTYVSRQLVAPYHPKARRTFRPRKIKGQTKYLTTASRMPTPEDAQLTYPTLVPHDKPIKRTQRFKLKEGTLNTLHTVPQVVNTKKNILSFQEATSLFGNYIMFHKTKMMDQGNKRIIICEQDELEHILGVRAFHLRQFLTLLRQQLIPVPQYKTKERPGPGNNPQKS